jgi:hypothetical protein
LIVKLLAALNQLGKEHVTPVINQLGAFINQVNAFMGHQLTSDQGQPLIDAANRIIDLLRPRERVVGFGYLSDIRDHSGNGGDFSVIKRADRVAPENASAALIWPLDSAFMEEDEFGPDLTMLLDEHQDLAHPLLAPALLR